MVSRGFLFLGIGLAVVNQWGEPSAHLIPFSQMGPQSVYSGVRRAGGGFLFHPSHAAHLPEQTGIGFALPTR